MGTWHNQMDTKGSTGELAQREEACVLPRSLSQHKWLRNNQSRDLQKTHIRHKVMVQLQKTPKL